MPIPALPTVPGLRHNHAGRDLERARLLAQVRAGQVPRADATSASRELIASAEVLGHATHAPCPICRRGELIHTRWVHGQVLGERSGTARSVGEIAAMLRELSEAGGAGGPESGPGEPGDVEPGPAEIAVHTVELCPRCGWNFIIATDTWCVANL